MKSSFHFLFDFDGVLIHKINFAGNVAQKYGVNEKALGEFFGKYLQPSLRGEEDMINRLEENLESLNWKGTAKELFEAIYIEPMTWQDDLVELVENDFSVNHHCHIATNQDHHRLQIIKDEDFIQQSFEEVFGSPELGVAKPDVLYFQKIYEQLKAENKNLQPNQLIFADDLAENVESAESFGINAHFFRKTEAFAAFVKRVISGKKFPVIEAEDIKMINMQFSQAKSYSDILSHEGTFHFLTESGPKNEAMAFEKIVANRNTFDHGNSIYWSIVNDKKEFLGYLAAHNITKARIAASFGIHPNFRKKGIASRAIKTFLAWEGLKGKTVEMATHLDNEASFGLLNKLGLLYQGIRDNGFGERHVFEVS